RSGAHLGAVAQRARERARRAVAVFSDTHLGGVARTASGERSMVVRAAVEIGRRARLFDGSAGCAARRSNFSRAHDTASNAADGGFSLNSLLCGRCGSLAG